MDSTSIVHYPAHIEALRLLRPGRTLPSIDQWLLRNFHGIMEYLAGDLAFTKEELAIEFEIWQNWTRTSAPPFFPGFLDLLSDYHALGGKVVVISHSEAEVIERHYRVARSPPLLPDLIFGWEHDAEKRKPSPWPVQEALRRLGCTAAEALIVDDLKPGVLMARASGVAIAAAGWSHQVAEIEHYMRSQTDMYCACVDDLRAILLPG